MDARGLEEAIISTVQEMQVKLGDTDGTVSLYMPISSIADKKDLEDVLRDFVSLSKDKLGRVSFQISGDRVNITVPPEGCRYVSNLPVSPILMTFVKAVSERWNLDKLSFELKNIDSTFKIKGIDDQGEGFDHVIWFPGGVDDHVYCISTHYNHLTYHRFSRKDYEEFGIGDLTD